jgi:hypothetical protein
LLRGIWPLCPGCRACIVSRRCYNAHTIRPLQRLSEPGHPGLSPRCAAASKLGAGRGRSWGSVGWLLHVRLRTWRAPDGGVRRWFALAWRCARGRARQAGRQENGHGRGDGSQGRGDRCWFPQDPSAGAGCHVVGYRAQARVQAAHGGAGGGLGRAGEEAAARRPVLADSHTSSDGSSPGSSSTSSTRQSSCGGPPSPVRGR